MTKQEIVNPIKAIKYLFNYSPKHVKYDKKVNKNYQYRIIRSGEHDGTRLCTLRILVDALFPVVNKQSYWTLSGRMITDNMVYLIGDIKIISKNKKIKFWNKDIVGIEDIVYVPVRIIYND